ncbi:MAG: hypothetical protein A3J66_04090 [Candidatus Magasanikbacteria bacterium RIFCSPHIGHO2_02_FULL_47_14]|uniref:M23ase beta-sheet core domain-containing protein n=1 Tax=Candidatus Magasanikbacteria bacterium RIFCSPHIGHO2_02_FULL_47_14 TaxID=1798680 RepID=A0A1F6MA36_9BACT|nr:MAG: hypothetical protein A3J66_04090 [Candidatus Magasanikbacteria bacterium RIFCSPHIGHO2_02_FULL_47_14]
MRVLNLWFIIWGWVFLPANSMAAYSGPQLKIPMKAGDSILLTVQAGGRVADVLGGGIDPFHTGNSYFSLDFDDRYAGDPVLAAASGAATVYRGQTGYGNYVVVDHGGRYSTLYAHLNQIIVQNGQSVRQGQRLGTIGNTGQSSGSHLHFELKYSGRGNDGNMAIEGARLDGLNWESYRAGQRYLSTNLEYTGFLYRPDGGENPHACADQPAGGADTNWTYSCRDQRESFESGETVWGLFRIDEVFSDHRFKVETFRDGVFQWEWTAGWNDVDERWGWRHAYFWPRLDNASPGLWEFHFFVDSGGGFATQPTGVITFEVEPREPFVFSEDGGTNPQTCADEPTGGAHTNWVYSCRDRRNIFRPWERVYGLLRIDRVFADHCFLVQTYRNGSYQWQWEWCNRGIDPNWGWEHAYFRVSQDNAQVGEWEFRFFVNAGQGYSASPLAAARFTVR